MNEFLKNIVNQTNKYEIIDDVIIQYKTPKVFDTK